MKKQREGIFFIPRTRQEGFSLVGVMVAAAIMGGLSLAIMRITEQQTKTQKTAEASFQIRSLSNEISQLLLTAESCKNTFDDLGSIENERDVSNIKNRLDENKISVGDTFDGDVEINRILLTDLDWGPLSTPSNTRFGEATLEVTMEKLSDMAQGGKTIIETFSLKFNVDDSYNVLSCYGATENAVDTAKKESCEFIGGTYDSSADTCNLATYEDPTPDRETAVSTKYLDEATCVPQIQVCTQTFGGKGTPTGISCSDFDQSITGISGQVKQVHVRCRP